MIGKSDVQPEVPVENVFELKMFGIVRTEFFQTNDVDTFTMEILLRIFIPEVFFFINARDVALTMTSFLTDGRFPFEKTFYVLINVTARSTTLTTI